MNENSRNIVGNIPHNATKYSCFLLRTEPLQQLAAQLQLSRECNQNFLISELSLRTNIRLVGISKFLNGNLRRWICLSNNYRIYLYVRTNDIICSTLDDLLVHARHFRVLRSLMKSFSEPAWVKRVLWPNANPSSQHFYNCNYRCVFGKIKKSQSLICSYSVHCFLRLQIIYNWLINTPPRLRHTISVY